MYKRQIFDQALKECTNPELKARLTSGVEITAGLIDRVRSLSLNLRPSMLDDFGLFPALTWLLEQNKKQSGIALQSNFTANADIRYPANIETAVFRVVQEALTNIVRHAEADHVWVTLEERGGELIVRVEDNGRGFDLQTLIQSMENYSTGISGMEERIRLAGGVFEIDPQIGGGTRITARFELEGKETDEDN